MNPDLDHVIWICNDLQHGSQRFEELTGVRPIFGGTHASGLTHNALVPLGERCYLEILAPTGAASAADDAWCRFARQAPEPRLFTYCMRSSQPLDDLAAQAHRLGCSLATVGGNGRITPEGVQLRWKWLQPTHEQFGLAFPFFIDWQNSAHPSQSVTAAGAAQSIRLRDFAVGHPDTLGLERLLSQLGVSVAAYAAPTVAFRLQLDTPRGIVSL
jgi:hypothetical protein